MIWPPHVGDDDLDSILARQVAEIGIEVIFSTRREKVEDPRALKISEDARDATLASQMDFVDAEYTRRLAVVVTSHIFDEVLEDGADRALVKADVVGDAIIGVLEAALHDELAQPKRHQAFAVERRELLHPSALAHFADEAGTSHLQDGRASAMGNVAEFLFGPAMPVDPLTICGAGRAAGSIQSRIDHDRLLGLIGGDGDGPEIWQLKPIA